MLTGDQLQPIAILADRGTFLSVAALQKPRARALRQPKLGALQQPKWPHVVHYSSGARLLKSPLRNVANQSLNQTNNVVEVPRKWGCCLATVIANKFVGRWVVVLSERIFEACELVSISITVDFSIGGTTADLTYLESTSIVTSNWRPPTFGPLCPCIPA